MQIGPLKAHGPNKLEAGFYQKHWGVIGEQITTTVLNILHGGGKVRSFNFTYNALIP